jgi:hypothetical protein
LHRGQYRRGAIRTDLVVPTEQDDGLLHRAQSRPRAGEVSVGSRVARGLNLGLQEMRAGGIECTMTAATTAEEADGA